MATDSTLQKIADNLLAQFDKTLLDNSTDFSSCDQILNAAPSEHKGGLESLYCDLLLDALISGYYRYSEMDTKQLVDDPLYTKFKKMVYGLDRSDPYNLLYYAIIDLVSGKKENVLQYLSAYLDEKIKSLKTESGIFTAEDFTYILVVPLKEGFPGMWSAIGRMLDRDDVEAGIPEMCAALDHLYYDSKNESIIESLTQVLQCNPKILLAKELLGYTYYNMQMLGNALSYFEQFEDGKPTSRIFLEGTVYFWMAWCYGKKKDCLKEEEYYRKSLEALPVGENTLNNLGYSLYKQRKFKEAQSVFEDCLRQNRDVRYAANNLVRTLLAQGKNGEAQRVIQEHERFVSKDLKKRAEKPVGKVKIAVPEPAVTDVEAETIVDIGVKKQQFSSEKLLEDELVLAFARKTTAGSTEIANQSSDRKTKQPRLANKYYSCWSAIGSTAFTLPVCTETVSSFFPRKLSPRSLNTVASSKMRSSAHRSVESSLKSSRQRAGFLLLVKTMLSFDKYNRHLDLGKQQWCLLAHQVCQTKDGSESRMCKNRHLHLILCR